MMVSNRLDNGQPIMIVGMPRSGTTWVSEVLTKAKGTVRVFEPDNEKTSPLAWLCKEGLHRFPYLSPGDDSDMYAKLWQAAFSGGPALLVNRALGRLMFHGKAAALEAGIRERTGLPHIDENLASRSSRKAIPYRVHDRRLVGWLVRQTLLLQGTCSGASRVVLKSVHAPLCMDWIASRFSVQMVVVLRNPFSLYASYKRMCLPDGYRNILAQPSLQRDLHSYVSAPIPCDMSACDRLASQIALMLKVMQAQLRHHPEWAVVSHDRLCMATREGYKQLFDRLGLPWASKVGSAIGELNQSGRGFEPRRVARLQPSKWRQELSGDEQQTIEHWVELLALEGFLKEQVW